MDGIEMQTETQYKKVINEQQINEAMNILQKYKEGKQFLDLRVKENDEWWRLRHYPAQKMREQKKADIRTDASSGWLLNGVLNKHADAMDSYPEFSCLPREEGDKEEAKRLSDILPAVLDMANFEQTYSDCWYDKLKKGTGIYGVFWDGSKSNGLGDIVIEPVNILDLFWEPGVRNIQDSLNLFYVQMVDKEIVMSLYPDIDSTKLHENEIIGVTKIDTEDAIDTTGKVEVVNWYYKRDGILHFCKFCCGQVLVATENEPENYPNGLYDHGKYPFVFDVLYPMENSPAGFGHIDIGKQAQMQIDRLNNAIVETGVAASKPRWLKSSSSAVNTQDLMDMDKQVIEVEGLVSDEYIKQFKPDQLEGIYVTIQNNLIEQLKETTGNRDVQNGGSTAGATAASAIAAMQEASGKLSRDMIKASYRAYREIILLCIELIRQFYTLPRQFRIVGENGEYRYIENYTNRGIAPQMQYGAMGEELGYTSPIFDIIVTAAKSSPYSKMAQNEFTLQLYSAGFFNPQMADQALLAIDMMDFRGKEEMMQKIQQNGTMYQMLTAMSQRLAQAEAALGIGQPMGGGTEPMPGAVNADKLDGKTEEEPKNVEKAKERAAASTEPV